tara:strand:+ start:383 stop:697 length:315 start_codon:yes stop_codon:yes gene_type:complete
LTSWQTATFGLTALLPTGAIALLRWDKAQAAAGSVAIKPGIGKHIAYAAQAKPNERIAHIDRPSGPRYTTRCGASRSVMWFASPTGKPCAKRLLQSALPRMSTD